MRLSFAFACFFSLLLGLFAPAAVAAPKTDEGVPVKVVVLDSERKPIPTAVIRHPLEQDRHRVNSVDGSFETSVLYMPDGTELRFTPGMTLDLEISAPGYTTQVFQYQVRKRRNVIEVKLEPIELENDQIEEPMITFGRDEPREASE
ncbi:MAG: hypothetical protein FJ102_24095 [Deltaproteobacteria bacterium]|nr:hypothetical protein [Deltaproteobacteria bacterium]